MARQLPGRVGLLFLELLWIKASSTFTIGPALRCANEAGRQGSFDLRHLFNGLIDSYLYHSGQVDTTLPFDELRRLSLINDAAQAADAAPDFSQRIRASLPTIRH